MTLGEQLRQLAQRAQASTDQATADRRARNQLMLKMDAEEGAKLREIAEVSGMSIGHVQRIIVRHASGSGGGRTSW